MGIPGRLEVPCSSSQSLFRPRVPGPFVGRPWFLLGVRSSSSELPGSFLQFLGSRSLLMLAPHKAVADQAAKLSKNMMDQYKYLSVASRKVVKEEKKDEA